MSDTDDEDSGVERDTQIKKPSGKKMKAVPEEVGVSSLLSCIHKFDSLRDAYRWR